MAAEALKNWHGNDASTCSVHPKSVSLKADGFLQLLHYNFMTEDFAARARHRGHHEHLSNTLS